MVINCVRDPIDVLMKLLLSIDDDDDEHQELVDGHRNDVRDREDNGLVEDAKEEGSLNGVETLNLKSSLKKVNLDSTEAEKKNKKKVQWVDVIGKELAEIREFESSEEDDMDSDGQKKCVCFIM